MQSIINQQLSLTDSAGKTQSLAQILILTLNQPPASGFDLSTIRARLSICAKLQAAQTAFAADATQTAIDLEDAEFLLVQEAVKNFRWGILHPDISNVAAAVKL